MPPYFPATPLTMLQRYAAWRLGTRLQEEIATLTAALADPAPVFTKEAVREELVKENPLRPAEQSLGEIGARMMHEAILSNLLPPVDVRIAAESALGEAMAKTLHETWLDSLTNPKPYVAPSQMEELVGKRIFAIFISPDGHLEPCEYGNHTLVFETDRGQVAYAAESDCCSVSYFNDVLGVDALLGQVVTTTEDVDLPDAEESRDAVTACYGIKLTTARGYADVIFRNDSNGYYGGWCSLIKNEVDPHGFTVITRDWSRDG